MTTYITNLLVATKPNAPTPLLPRDVLMAALAAALPEEALPACKKLDLNGNQIGGAGCEALAAALDTGALPKCEEISLCGNMAPQEGADAPQAAATKRAIELHM